MAILVPLSDLTTKLTSDESLPICEANINRPNYFLIIESEENINSRGNFDATINLQSSPAVSCTIYFRRDDTNLHGKVTFTGPASNLQYEMSFYYVSSTNTVEFLETLNVSGVNVNSSFHLKEKYEFLYYNQSQRNYSCQLKEKYAILYRNNTGNNKRFSFNETTSANKYLFLIVSLQRKDSIFIKLEIPHNDIPAQFASLYKDQLLTDFKIICGNKEFSVHKAVLAVRCSVFRAMFQHETKETLNNQIEITDFEPKIVEEMVSFLYEDKISTDLIQEELEKTILIADKYSLEKLKIICMQEMTKTVETVSDVLETYLNLKSLNVPKFKEAVLQFIEERQQFPHISKPEEKKDLVDA